MSAFDDDLAEDAATFINGDEFAEDVVYTPYKGVPITIKAVIDRRNPSRLAETSQNLAADDLVAIRNHATLGIVSPQEHKDKIRHADNYGGDGTNGDHTVTQAISGDAGVWILKIR